MAKVATKTVFTVGLLALLLAVPAFASVNKSVKIGDGEESGGASSVNGSITVGGRPVALCSESERWRGQVACQLSLAALTQSKVAVLDRGDILDANNRQGLVRAVKRVSANAGELLSHTAWHEGELCRSRGGVSEGLRR